jgi:molybdopterin molybdotransferase
VTTADAYPDDVRMRGFRARSDVAEVEAWVDALPVPAAESVEVGLEHAAGRVLARDLVSDVSVPPFARAAMDGWAVRGEDTFGAGELDAVELRVVGVSLPGRPFPGTIGAGEAARIMTGAPVPAGADAVLRAESGQESSGRLLVRAPVPPRRHVGQVGEDVTQGARVLAAGRRLRPQDVGLAASIGYGCLLVRSAPRVGILLTGSELLAPGARPTASSIVDSNGPMLAALVRRDGGEVVALARVPDDEARLDAALREFSGDVLLVSGASSVGEEDHVPRLVAAAGELAFHGVAMRPASPTGAGLLAGRPVFLLPGNPVSCLSAYDFFAGRAIRRFAGRRPAWPYRSAELPLARKLVSDLGRVDYIRVRVVDGRVEPVMARGASLLSSTTEADGFVVVARDSEGAADGAVVRVWLYDA